MSALPDCIEPMKARAGKLPADEGEFGFEVKWDGIRALAYVEDGRLLLRNRNLRDITSQYPELVPLGAELSGRNAVLDGEIVAFDEAGRPSFQRLQHRMHLASDAAAEQAARHNPIVYAVFDVLHLDGRSLLRSTYEDRRGGLDELALRGANWQTPAWRRGDGTALLDASRSQGLEGVVAKKLSSCYHPGRRSSDWIKVKNQRRQEVVVCGWMPGEGSRSARFGSLLAGVYDGGELRYVGNVGTGFSEPELDRLHGLLAPLRRDLSPFAGRQPKRGAVFCEPSLVADVEFLQWTTGGTLRAPSYKGLRDDLEPNQVVRQNE
jgi:bifunctional non-homologous end joining protein LigD